jgi:plastocyanin
MADLHPHWQQTDDDEQPVAVRIVSNEPASESAPVPRAKRGPGAIVGISIFFAIGFAFAQGIGGLLGQTSRQETIVTISGVGITPVITTVRAGETITWENADGIPHIIQSDTLPTADNKPYESSAIFPQSSVSYAIPATAKAGTYDYISTTAKNVAGQIMIVAAASPSSGSQQSQAFSQFPVVSGQMENATGSVFTGVEQSFPTGVIPTNPNTVGSPNANIPARQRPIANTAGSVTQHAPVAHAQTGSEMLIVVAASICAFGFVTRRILRGA